MRSERGRRPRYQSTANSSEPNLALTGYDIGPGSVAAVGEAAYPEPSAGPGSTKTTGVFGIAPDGDGVMGQTSVQHGCCFTGIGQSTSDYAGVIGVDESSNGGYNAGVVGVTTNGLYGVEGISSAVAIGGVEGLGANEDGVDGLSASGIGVRGASNSRIGVFATSASNDAVYAVSLINGVHATTSGNDYAALFGQNSRSWPTK